MRARILFPATLGLLVLCGIAEATAPAEVEQRVRSFVEASNRQDVGAMLAATDPAFRWMQIAGDKLTVEVAGHTDLRSWLEGYFRHTPDARSTLGAIMVDGEYASVVETVEYKNGDGEAQKQTATSVYQLNPDGLIRNVWYFPAQPVPPAP